MQLNKLIKNTDRLTSRRWLLHIIVLLITLFLPNKSWYRSAFFWSRKLAYFNKKGMNSQLSTPYKIAERLNTLLSILRRTNTNFHIPSTLTGEQYLGGYENGIIICTVHLPLIKVGVANLMNNGFVIDAAIAGKPTDDGFMSVWGSLVRIPVIVADVNSLIRVKSLLQNNKSIGLMVDSFFQKPISPNIFRLASKIGAKVVFLYAYLREDGLIETTIELPPYPFSRNEVEVEANINAIKNGLNSVLGKYQNL